MPDGEKLKKIYDAVSTKYDLGTYDEFAQKLQDPNRRKKLYDAVSQDFDLGDYTTFNQKLGFDSKEVQQSTQQVSEFAEAKPPTGQITQEQVLKGQQQLQAAKVRTTEQQNIAQYGGKIHEQKTKQLYDAAVNTVAKRPKTSAFGIPEGEQVNELLAAADKGDVAITKDAQGKDVLKRTGNFLQSFKAAADETYRHQLESNYVSSLPKDKAIEYLNQKRQHPELFTPEQDIAPTGISKMAGEQADILGKGIIGGMAATASGGSAGFGTFLAMSKDLAAGGYSDALQKNFNLLKEQHTELSDNEIYDKAHNAALTGEVVSLGTGAILSAELPKANVDISGVLQMFKSSPRVVGSAALGSVLNDVQTNAIAAGQGVTWEQMKQNAEDAATPMVIMHFGLGSVAAAVNGVKSDVPSYIRPQLENVVASANREEVRNFYQTGEQNGMFPQGTTQKALDKLNEFDVQKEVVKNMPISEEKKAAIAGKLIQRKDLVEQTAQLKNYGGAFNDKVEANEKQISSIDEDINKIYSADDFLKHEKDNLTGEKANGTPTEQPITTIPEEKGKEETAQPIEKGTMGVTAVNEPTIKPTTESKQAETSTSEVVQAPTETKPISSSEVEDKGVEIEKNRKEELSKLREESRKKFLAPYNEEYIKENKESLNRVFESKYNDLHGKEVKEINDKYDAAKEKLESENKAAKEKQELEIARNKKIHEESKPKLELDLLGKEEGTLKKSRAITADKILEKVKDEKKAKEFYKRHENIRGRLETLKKLSECL